MRLSLLLLAVLATGFAVTSTSATNCSYAGYDFSSLTYSDLTASDSTYDYYLRPCGIVSPVSCTSVASAASACQVQVNPAGGSWVTALESNPLNWGLLPFGQGVYYNQTGTQTCWASGSPTAYYTIVEFICSSNSTVSVSINGCTQTYQVQTSLACGVTPPPTSACGYNGLDFSSYTGVDIQGTDGTSTYSYYLRVCGSVSSVPSCTQIAPTAAACQVQVNPAGATFDNGNWAGYASTNWQFVDASNPNAGVMYTMLGAQSCWASGSPENYYTNVRFVCSASEQPLVITTSQNSCVMNYTIATPKACASPPPPPSKCAYNGLDFSTLMGTDIQGSDGGSVYQYYLSVCGPLNSQPTCLAESASSSACQEQVNPKGESFDIGNWSPNTQWYTLENGKGAGYMLTGNQDCWATGSPTNYYAYVDFVCSETQGPLTVTVPSMSCVQNYTYPTPLACGSSPTTTCRASIDGVTYDLSALTKSDFIWQYSPTELFAVHVCGTVSNQACTSSLPSTTAACLASSQGTFDMGDAFPVPGLPPLQYIDPNNPSLGVTIELTGANTCASEPGRDENWTSHLNLVCAQSQGSLTVSSVSNCEYNWTISTPLGCPPGHTFETKLSGFSDNSAHVFPKPPKMPAPAIATE